MFFPIICQAFVEFSILFTRNIISTSGPDWLRFVQLFIFSVFLLDFLFLLLVAIFFFSIFILTNILNLWFLFSFLFLFLFLLLFCLVITNFLLSLLLDHQFNGISDKLGMFLDNFLDFLFLNIFSLVFLHLKNNLCTSSKRFTVVLLDGKRASSR